MPITEEEYREKKEVALKEKARFLELLNDTDGRVTSWANNMDSAFQFIARAEYIFEHGTKVQQKAIPLALGSNLLLNFQKLFMDTEKTLMPMETLAGEVRGIHKRLEPVKNAMTQSDLEQIYAENTILSAYQGSNLGQSP